MPVPWRFPKEGGEACLWHTILLARSSVLYLLFREAGKGVMPPSWAARLYPPKTAAKNCEGMSRVWLLFLSRKQGRNEMQPALPAEQEVYKSLVPPQRRSSKRCLQNDSTFRFFRPECFQNESRFSSFAHQTQRMIMPRSESVRDALQEGL